MKILVIGGTRFVGRHLVDAALAHGHEITLFNRGQSNADCSRRSSICAATADGDLGGAGRAALGRGGRYLRLRAQASCASRRNCSRDAVDRYLFVSTISVYDEPMQRARTRTLRCKSSKTRPSRKSPTRLTAA